MNISLRRILTQEKYSKKFQIDNLMRNYVDFHFKKYHKGNFATLELQNRKYKEKKPLLRI